MSFEDSHGTVFMVYRVLGLVPFKFHLKPLTKSHSQKWCLIGEHAWFVCMLILELYMLIHTCILCWNRSEQIDHENTKESSNAVDDTGICDQLCILGDLYNQLWMQTSKLNERYKFSLVLNIANDFTWLVGLLYDIFMCLRKREQCDFLTVNLAACILCTFHLSMICIAGQNSTDAGLRVAHALHRNKFIKSSIKLNSLVSEIFIQRNLEHWLFFHHLHFQILLMLSFQIRQFSFQLLHQPIKLKHLGFSMLITHFSLRLYHWNRLIDEMIHRK